METGRSNWNNNNGDVKQLGSGIWTGDACWHSNQVMTGLEYKNDGSNFYWRYQCSGPLYADGQYTPVNTKRDGPGSGSVQWSGGLQFLDRQRAFCGIYNYLTSFKFDKVGGDLKLSFTCTDYWNQANYYQTDYYTGWNDRGSGINFLDRHSLKCPGGSAISGFEGITGSDQTRNVVRGSIPGNSNGRFQFHYICATANIQSFPSPTPLPTSAAPVANPTPRPIALPTTAPSPAPVADPTLKPISLPTTAPSPAPIANPTAAPQRLSIFNDAQGSWVDTGRSNWRNNNGDVKQLGSGIWTGDACWHNNQAMTGLEYKGDGDNFYWRYQCTGPLVLNGASNPVNTKRDGPGSGSTQWSGNIAYLDRQRAFCGYYNYLTSFKFDKVGGDLKLSFTCTDYWNQADYSQTDYYTGWNERGGINYLDRHSMKCPGGTAMSGFEGITANDQTRNVVRGSIPGNSNGRFQFHYICATAIVQSFPSPAPTLFPTLVPISKPTAVPSPVPISDPTESPISDPTTAPSPVPIADPTEAPTESPISEPTESPISEPTLPPIADPSEAPVASPTDAPIEEGGDEDTDVYPGQIHDTHDFNNGGDEDANNDFGPGQVHDILGSANIRPFVFTKGVTPEVPPTGVVLVADKDINFLKPGQISNAAYIIGPDTNVDGASLAKDVLVNKVSTIVPGEGTKVTFFSKEDLTGFEYTFTPKTYQALTNFHYHNSKAGNDAVGSIYVWSDVDGSFPQVARRTRVLRT